MDLACGSARYLFLVTGYSRLQGRECVFDDVFAYAVVGDGTGANALDEL